MRSCIKVIILLIAFSLFSKVLKSENQNFELILPKAILKGVNTSINVKTSDESFNDTINAVINGKDVQLLFHKGIAEFEYEINENEISIVSDTFQIKKNVRPIPLWLSILPPLIAIFMALLFREVLSSLFIGIFSGAFIIYIYKDGAIGIFSAFLAVLDEYIIKSLNNWDHLAVIIFSMTIGGMVTLISKNGGMQGVVDKISVYAKNARSGQLVTWILGVIIFFDDYANTLVVGNTMRPVTDKLKISREKLSYLVDSSAAPIAAIAFVTTWIGAELGYIKDSVENIADLNESAYAIFFNSLQYSFYPILTLFFMLMLIWKAKDFGPMYKAEVRSRTSGKVSSENSKSEETVHEEVAALNPKAGVKVRWYNAAIPVLVIIIGTICGLLYTGWDSEIWNSNEIGFVKKLSKIIGNANSYLSLLWSSLTALAVAMLLTLSQRLLNLTETLESITKGFKTMLSAILILVMAWSLAAITEDLHTADFITHSLLSFKLSPEWIPAITFIIAGIISFSTGSSWGTMAILYPLILPASWLICKESNFDYQSSLAIFHNVASCVLAGSVLGDHCSPISDTTILSSLASSCNHIDHVKTQMPYALTVGAVSVIFGTIPSALGISSLLLFPISIFILFLIIQFFGKKIN
ncbi:MAG: Na+/H+ antiporter NhaC family protein [Bacteroidia bacterium]